MPAFFPPAPPAPAPARAGAGSSPTHEGPGPPSPMTQTSVRTSASSAGRSGQRPSSQTGVLMDTGEVGVRGDRFSLHGIWRPRSPSENRSLTTDNRVLVVVALSSLGPRPPSRSPLLPFT